MLLFLGLGNPMLRIDLSFPKNIIAGMFGFTEKDYFEISNTDKEVPNVSFD